MDDKKAAETTVDLKHAAGLLKKRWDRVLLEDEKGRKRRPVESSVIEDADGPVLVLVMGHGAGAQKLHNNDLLVQVLVAHQRNGHKGCHCGWNPLGKSYAQHVADIYEAALGGPE